MELNYKEFSEEKAQKLKNIFLKCSPSLVSRDMQMKTT